MLRLSNLKILGQGDLKNLPAADLKWLAGHYCPHRKPYLTHPSCFVGKKEPKAMFLDLEISPMESMTYGPMHEATILSVVRSPYIFCFSYCDIRNGKVNVVSLPDFPLYKKEPFNDIEVVKELHKILSSADYVIAHNINFDWRVAKARFIKHKLSPIIGVKTICTLKLARKIAQFPANSLKELAIFLGVKHKMETSKYLWQKIHIDQDKKSWKEMCLYNKVDSEVGREIFHILEKWSDKVLIK